MKPRLVFISHSSDDTWVARQIAREVAACGASPFLDEADVDLGSDFEEVIFTTLEVAHEMVVLLTPWAIGRGWISAEVGAARLRRLPITPILHGIEFSAFQNSSNLPSILTRREAIRLNDIDQYFQKLKLRVGAVQ